jgi:hypothetical protein
VGQPGSISLAVGALTAGGSTGLTAGGSTVLTASEALLVVVGFVAGCGGKEGIKGSGHGLKKVGIYAVEVG